MYFTLIIDVSLQPINNFTLSAHAFHDSPGEYYQKTKNRENGLMCLRTVSVA